MIYLENTDYPFEESIISISKIKIDRIPKELLTDNMQELMYPDVMSSTVAYHHAFTKENWERDLADLIIFVLERT